LRKGRRKTGKEGRKGYWDQSPLRRQRKYADNPVHFDWGVLMAKGRGGVMEKGVKSGENAVRPWKRETEFPLSALRNTDWFFAGLSEGDYDRAHKGREEQREAIRNKFAFH